MYNVDVGKTLGTSYVPLAEDVFKTVTIQVVVQLMLSAIDPNSGFFNPVFWLILAYLILGLLVYHLVLKKLIVIS